MMSGIKWYVALFALGLNMLPLTLRINHGSIGIKPSCDYTHYQGLKGQLALMLSG